MGWRLNSACDAVFSTLRAEATPAYTQESVHSSMQLAPRAGHRFDTGPSRAQRKSPCPSSPPAGFPTMKLSSLVLALALAGSNAKLEVNSKVRGMLQCACKSIHCAARRFDAESARVTGRFARRRQGARRAHLFQVPPRRRLLAPPGRPPTSDDVRPAKWRVPARVPARVTKYECVVI